jgi:hypothetical protein
LIVNDDVIIVVEIGKISQAFRFDFVLERKPLLLLLVMMMMMIKMSKEEKEKRQRKTMNNNEIKHVE